MRPWVLPLLLVPLPAALLLSPVAAEEPDRPKPATILFKDGFSMRGYVIREKKTIWEGNPPQPIELQEGFFMLDDGPRRTIFSLAYADKVLPDPNFAPEKDAISSYRSIDYSFGRPLPPIRETVEGGPWEANWDRTFKYHTTDRHVSGKQHLSILTPSFARLDSIPHGTGTAFAQPYRWNSYYLTRELGPDQVTYLLSVHRDSKDDRELSADKRSSRWLLRVQFLLQAGWYDPAEKELERMAKELPGQTDRLEEARASIKKLRALKLVDDLRTAHAAGRFQWVEKQLSTVPEDVLTEQALSDLRTLKNQYETAREKLKQIRRYLAELPAALPSPDQRALVAEVTKTISAELTPDNLGRLETFLGQAQQAERQTKNQQKPELGPAQLLALAISGWLLGNTAAESKVEVAQRLWQARQFVLEYQRANSVADRRKLREKLESHRGDGVALDELAQLIASLPPPEPEEKLDTTVKEMKTAGRRPVTYHLQLPPEYAHARSWPVLLVLHQGGEKATTMLQRWSELASEHGYLLVAPEWSRGSQSVYTYSTEEQAAVLDVLRDLRRHFQVDSDRVFLSGLGQGGDMAYDVALSHPDLFAGVVPIGGYPGRYPFRYRHNGQYVPFYVIQGDRSGDTEESKAMFREWVPHSYPVLYVQYKGRGLEWFAAELPVVFDWMDRKKRANPINELGRPGEPFGDEFLTLRSTDNRFYWLTSSSLDEKLLCDGAYKATALGATMQASRGKNHINVRVKGVKQVSVWLGTGDGAVDFDKEVTIYLNADQKFYRKVTPSLETLMEDYYDRGDRQRLYLARVDLDVR
jgi:pimeloyl-ACP methyl ester carboxylesterase